MFGGIANEEMEYSFSEKYTEWASQKNYSFIQKNVTQHSNGDETCYIVLLKNIQGGHHMK